MSAGPARKAAGPQAAAGRPPLVDELHAGPAEHVAYPSNPVLRRLLERGAFEHDGRSYRAAHSMEPAVLERVGRLVQRRRLARGLEIGTLYGLSTLYLAEALAVAGGRLDTVDLRPEEMLWDRHRSAEPQPIRNVHEVAERLVAESGYADAVRFIAGDSADVLPRLAAEGARYDIAVVDGAHAFPQVLLDAVGADALLEVGGYLVLDDVHPEMAERGRNAGGPARVLESLFAGGRYAIVPLSRHTVICRKEREA